MCPADTSLSRPPRWRSIVFGCAPVHRIHEGQALHAKVILGARLDEHFFERRDLRIPPGLRDRDRRRAVLEHVDRVIQRRWHVPAGGIGELHLVEATSRHGDLALPVDRCRRASSTTVSLPSSTSLPAVVAMVERISTRTRVPRIAAMSPPSSTRCGESLVYSGYRYSRSIRFTDGRSATDIRNAGDRTGPAST